MRKMTNEGEHISYSTLMAAKQGDVIAIQSIVDTFRGYITSRSLRIVKLPDGSTYEYVDADVHRRMETEMIEAIFKFKIR